MTPNFLRCLRPCTQRYFPGWVLALAMLALVGLPDRAEAQNFQAHSIQILDGYTARVGITWSNPSDSPSSYYGGGTDYWWVSVLQDGQEVASCSTGWDTPSCWWEPLPAHPSTGAYGGYWSYEFRITPANHLHGSFFQSSTSVSGATVYPPAPAAPSITSSSAGNGSVTIGWSAPSYATQYYVYRSGVHVQTVSTTSATVTGLTNGTAYYFEVAASNVTGTSSRSAAVWLTPATVPSAPTGLSATPGNTTASVAFTAGANGGSAITNYQYTLNGGTTWTSAGTASSPVSITGLTNGTSYNVQLRAVNAMGAGTASAAVSVTPRTTPSAPTGVTVTPGNTTATIAFTAGATGGSAITDYQYSLNGGVTYFGANTTTSPIVLTGLTNGTTYAVRLRAVNAVGAGTATSDTNVTPRTTPSPPTSLVATPGAGSASIAFTAGATGGSAITNYEYTLDAGVTWTSAATAVSPVSVTGLTNGTSYNVQLRAVNAAGVGASSSSVTVTPRTTPSAPTGVTVTAGDTTASIAFTAGPDGGSAITDYQYSLNGGMSYSGANTTASPILLTGLTNGTTYTVRLRAVNAAGAGTATSDTNVTPRTTPSAPTSLVATAGDGSASIAFTAGATGGSAITGYQYTLDGGGTWTTAASAVSPVSVTSLTNGTAYTVHLRAVNAAGAGATSSSVTVTPRTTPSAPTNLVATPGNTTATIAFTAGADGGSAITSYQYSINGGSSWSGTGSLTSPFTITGLTNGILYTVRLRAVNAAGSGAFGSVTVTPYTTPSAPTSLVATAGNASASIAFTAGATGGSTVTDYEYTLNGGTSWTSAVTAVSPVAITGLINGTAYSVQLRAVNAAGAGTASSSVAVTPRTTPSAPTNLVATPGNTTATIAYTAGDDGGSAITSYQYSINGGSSWSGTGSTTSPFTITGLTNGILYTVRLRAVNAAGSGAFGSVTVTPFTTPSAPTSLVATAGNASASIAFTAGASGGSTITDYEYTLNGGTSWTSAASAVSPLTITGLTNGTAYSVQLRAVNAAGGGTASSSVAVTPVTTPSAPASMVATPGNTTATIAFTAGADGGSVITGYQYSTNGGSSWSGTGSTTSPFTITGLTNGILYTVRLRGVNAVGTGAVAMVTVTPRTTPSAPTSLVATAGNTTASIAFTAGASGGSTITDYEYTVNGGTSWTSAATAVSPVSLTGLTNGTAYSVQLRAVNAAGAGIASTAVAVTPVTTPSAPTNLVATPGNTSTTVAFTAGADGGSAITGYQYSTNGGSSWSGTGSTTSPFTVTGLTNGILYTVRLRAVNAVGTGAIAMVTVTPMTTPSAPTSLVATAGNTTASIAFTAGASGGSTITDYEYTLNGGTSWTSAATAVSPLTITGLTNGTAYTVQLRAVNAAGAGATSSSVSVTPATTPSAPTNLVATPGNSSASVAFTAGSDGGSPITSYQYSTNGGISWTGAGVATSPVTVTGLTNGVTTTLRLRAVNAVGTGAIAMVTVTPMTTPSAPTSLVATAGNTTASIAFTAGASGGSTITDYEYSLNGGTSWTSAGTVVSPIVLTGLTNATAYSVQVRAVNAAGAGVASQAVTVTPRGLSSPPSSLVATPGNTTATIAFLAGATGGSAITDYEYTLNDGVTWVSGATATSPLSLTGLINGTAYTVQLRAVNIVGASAASAPVTVTPRTVPSAPLNLVATAGNTTATITFTAGASGGSAITDYEYTLNGGATWTSAVTSVGPVVLTGLTNATDYSIQVRAVNAAGAGAASLAVTVTPRGVPLAPASLVATPGNTTASIAFTAGATGGSAIIDYEYTLNDGVTWVSAATATSPLTITGLTNGTPYTVRLRAVNVVGAGTASAAVTVTPRALPSAPTTLVATAADTAASVAFTAGAAGGSAILDYEFTLNGGTSWTSAATTASPVVLTGLTNGTTYTVQLRAVNGAGAGAASVAVTVTPRGVPSAPTSLVSTAGNTTASIAFTAGATGGSAITDYEYTLNGGASWTSAATVVSPLSITGLTNGTAYTVQLRAVNAAGAGAASAAVTVTPAVAEVIPTVTAPSSVNVTASTATLGGTVTGDGGAAITERGIVYAFSAASQVPVIGGFGVTQIAAPATGTGLYAVAATALTPGRTYTFRAYATNSAGTAYSGVGTFTTLSSTAALDGLVLSAGTLMPAFAPESLDFSASVPHTTSVLRVTATAAADAAGTEVQINGGGYSPVTSGTLSGALPLQVGSNVIHVRVTAQDGFTQRIYTVTVTRPVAPTAPSGLVGTPGDGRMTIAFTAGSDGGSPITNYEYSLTGGTTWLSAGTSASPVVITGLVNGTGYSVLLRAVTVAGVSPASAPVSVTPHTTPGVPTALTVTPGHARVTIAFAAAPSGGSPITGYNYSLDDGATWTASGLTASPMVVSGLVNGRTYVVRVRATNAAGLGPMSSALAVTPEAVPITFALSSASWTAPVTGGTTQVQITASADDAVWAASTEAGWLTLSGSGGLGNGLLSITAAPQASYAVARSATVLVAGQTVTVTQAATTEPGPPQQLTAALTGQRVVFRWNAPADSGAGVGGYLLEYGFTPGRSDGAALAIGTAREFAVTVPPGRFYVRVKAQNAYGISAASNEVELRAGITAAPPSRPQAVSAQVTGSTLRLTWSAPAGGDAPTGYVLEAGTAAGLSNIANVSLGPATSFVAEGIPAGLYFVRMRAVNSFGMSEPSEDVPVAVGSVAQPPQRPIGVTATVTGRTVTFMWNAPTQGGVPTGYVLEAGTGSGLSDITALPIGPAPSFTVGDVPPGTYFVRVRAVNALGASGPSSEVVVTVPPGDRTDGGDANADVAAADPMPASLVQMPRRQTLQGQVRSGQVSLWWTPVSLRGRTVTSRLEVLGESDGALVATVEAGQAHEAAFDDVPPGRYVVRVRTLSGGYDLGTSSLLHVWVPEP